MSLQHPVAGRSAPDLQAVASVTRRTASAPGLFHPVVHIVEQMAPGGIETLALDLVRGSSGEARLISLKGTASELVAAWPALATLDGFLEGLNGGDGLRPSLIGRLYRRLRGMTAGAVVLHHIGPLLYGGLAARLAGIPAIVHVEHDLWHYDAFPRHRLLAGLAERLVRPRHVTLSGSAAAELRKILPQAQIEVIATGIDLNRFRDDGRALARAALGLRHDEKAIGAAGRLVPVKGHADLLRAFAKLDRADARLFILGDGPEGDPLRAMAGAFGIASRVRFLGHRDDIAELLPGLDVFVLPSLAEGLPRVLLEAQACGVPVVATRVGSVADAVCPASGRLVAPADPAALAAAITASLDTAQPVSPRAFVEQRYDWQRTLAAYRRITGGADVG